MTKTYHRIRLGVRHVTFAAAAVLALSVPALASPATPGLTLFDTDQAAIEGLMTPIKPLLGGVGSTTSIDQFGTNNTATSGTTGSGNLSVIQQYGRNNHAVQAIDGANSAALLVQGGHDNNVAQVIKGNDDFQLVGVSGRNNDVAYVQVGNSLAGALDVTNSVNTTVLAFQTPSSGKFLMPTGLSGLKNAYVVVVPGRMYVIPKKH